MDKKRLGKTTTKVSPIGLGCATFGREIDQDTSFRLMDYAIEKGINFFDTAETYGGGESREYRWRLWNRDDIREMSDELHSSEKIIGRWLRARGCRNDIVLETKVHSNFTHDHVIQALDESLERLQTNMIDSYLFHVFDQKTQLEESLEGMSTALRSGRICAAGCSNFSA
jgi:aryl-alcohol dehydrogenase-like predicted oxidoreductase